MKNKKPTELKVLDLEKKIKENLKYLCGLVGWEYSEELYKSLDTILVFFSHKHRHHMEEVVQLMKYSIDKMREDEPEMFRNLEKKMMENEK